MSAAPDIEKLMRLKLEAERLANRPTDEQREQFKDEERKAAKELSGQIYAHGCVCPPGAERTCRGPLCPRQKWTVT